MKAVPLVLVFIYYILIINIKIYLKKYTETLCLLNAIVLFFFNFRYQTFSVSHDTTVPYQCGISSCVHDSVSFYCWLFATKLEVKDGSNLVAWKFHFRHLVLNDKEFCSQILQQCVLKQVCLSNAKNCSTKYNQTRQCEVFVQTIFAEAGNFRYYLISSILSMDLTYNYLDF